MIISDRGDHFLLAERQVLKLAAAGDAGNAVGNRVVVLHPNIITIDGKVHSATGGPGLDGDLLLIRQRHSQAIVVGNRQAIDVRQSRGVGNRAAIFTGGRCGGQGEGSLINRVIDADSDNIFINNNLIKASA
ncbi:hypothetical protein EHSB41UT_03753 [Parendozoicomonas haliclonae]|uniref:Uncharacterized protein n=1 Tax=Parendozoicomonas haliclonae TaxID=1960125 RepID=A0A1X7APB6_9GAMM|nr:hypothetical protein EHSB41UT_03753 [Parendozoicomonas haliclonae]